MNIVDILKGVLFGYGFRVMQIGATLLVVPFLIDTLGLERYGRIFAITSALGATAIATDGLKLSFARSISKSIEGGASGTSRYLGAGLKALLLPALLLSVFAVAADGPLLALLGIPDDAEYRGAIALAALAVAVETGLFAIHAYLTARGRLDLINGLAAGEVVIRNASFVAYFINYEANATAYLCIFVSLSTVRYLIMFIYAIRRWPEDFRELSKGRLREAWGAVSYSLPLTFDSLQHYVFQRLSIPLVNRFFGPAEAGLLALGINTISSNLAQVLFTVIRPILVPVAARLDLENMATSTRKLLLNVDSLFAVCVAATMVPLISMMPTVVGAWLGVEYDALVLPAQLLVAGTTISISFNVRRSLLVGQGQGWAIAKVSLVIAVAAGFALAWALTRSGDWIYVTVVIAGFSALSTILAVGVVFEQFLLKPEARKEHGTLRRTGAWLIAIAAAMWLSRFAPTTLAFEMFIPPLGSLLVVGIVTQLFVLPLSELRSTVTRLRGNARRSLFTTPEGPSAA